MENYTMEARKPRNEVEAWENSTIPIPEELMETCVGALHTAKMDVLHFGETATEYATAKEGGFPLSERLFGTLTMGNHAVTKAF